MTATTMIVMKTSTFFVKTILTKKFWFVKPEISLSVDRNHYSAKPECDLEESLLRWQ